MMFDHGFLSAKVEDETVTIQVVKDTRSKMLLVHLVHRKGLCHKYGTEEINKDIQKLNYAEMILRYDDESL